ncbi:hypothetical protein [Streptomyces sp. S465]|uniref:hypothetical protein n=1 Tax=Streptomyces sp. S465 TaxID=2979468 RepID=UPI0022A84987|nr:hypothetical protein [Streptomyces sp. S465]WAP60155.1 hypothetical protein N6H00_37250 [Streptomyces sp. S465]
MHVYAEELRAAEQPRTAADRGRYRAAHFAHRPKWARHSLVQTEERARPHHQRRLRELARDHGGQVQVFSAHGAAEYHHHRIATPPVARAGPVRPWRAPGGR